MDDGLLDVCIVGGVAPLKLLTMLPSVYTGSHLNVCEIGWPHYEVGQPGSRDRKQIFFVSSEKTNECGVVSMVSGPVLRLLNFVAISVNDRQ